MMSEIRDIQAKDVQIRDISNQKTPEVMSEVCDVQLEDVKDYVKSS